MQWVLGPTSRFCQYELVKVFIVIFSVYSVTDPSLGSLASWAANRFDAPSTPKLIFMLFLEFLRPRNLAPCQANYKVGPAQRFHTTKTSLNSYCIISQVNSNSNFKASGWYWWLDKQGPWCKQSECSFTNCSMFSCQLLLAPVHYTLLHSPPTSCIDQLWENCD